MNLLRLAVILSAIAIASCGTQRKGVSLDSYSSAASLSAAESLQVNAQLRRAADLFVRVWRYHWEVSDRYRYLAGYELSPQRLAIGTATSQAWPPPPGYPRISLTREEAAAVAAKSKGIIAAAPFRRPALVHCHPGITATGAYDGPARYIVPSGPGDHAICPTFYAIGVVPPWDEGITIDNALIDPFKPRIAAIRDSLLGELARGGALLPGDAWIAGQRVRFAVDQRDTGEVRSALAGCRAAPWWCSALTGYAMHQLGNTDAADSAFQRMLQLLPEDERCHWTDLRDLLETSDRGEYARIPCAKRDSINATIWWLSDAVYSDRGNDRRAEHYSRRMLVLLRGATSFHERWDMRPEGGGLGVEEMLMRFGWPSFSYWMGRAEDRSHFGFLGYRSPHPMINHGRFATAEYSTPRLRLFPRWRAIASPYDARDSDWAINAAAVERVYGGGATWWPVEHYARRAGPMLQLWDQQHGLFRRQDSILIAMAALLPTEEFPGAARDTLRGNLFAGTASQSMRAAPASGEVGGVSFARMSVPSQPQLLSLELHGRWPFGVVARTRFGIETPPVLAQLQAGEIAVAPPVFIRPITVEELAPDNPEVALTRMYGSTDLRDPQTVGLYWETYGIGPRDSVELTIRVERTAPGILRRLGYAFGLGGVNRGAIAVEWNESQPRRSTNIVSGTVPIQGRVLTLNISQLRSGDYAMIVSAVRPGGVPASAVRYFSLIR